MSSHFSKAEEGVIEGTEGTERASTLRKEEDEERDVTLSSSSSTERVIWRLFDGDPNFCSPYTYARALVQVPGIRHPVSMNRRINQSVCNFIRDHFVPRDSDVWLATYPKSGTTWVQNILSYLLYDEPNFVDGIGVGLTDNENVQWFEAQCTNSEVKEVILNTNAKISNSSESPIVDITNSAHQNIARINSLYESGKRRRCFKSHSPLAIIKQLMTSRGKVLHIARNPKDVCVSLWHHSRTKDFGYAGPFDHFLEVLFCKGQVESGSWWEYVLPFWLSSIGTMTAGGISTSKSNIMTVWYEDFLASPERCIAAIADFLNIDVSPSRVSEINRLCSFDVMKEAQSTGGVALRERKVSAAPSSGDLSSPSANQIRKGGVGGWNKYFTTEQSRSFDKFNKEEVRRCIIEFFEQQVSSSDAETEKNQLIQNLEADFFCSIGRHIATC